MYMLRLLGFAPNWSTWVSVAVAAWAAGARPTTVTAAATAAASVTATLGELRFMVVDPFVPPSGQGPGPTGCPSCDGPSTPRKARVR